jgi:phosphoribosylformylglycinamidine synthase I
MIRALENTVRIAVVRFPGSNADWDALHAARDVLGADAYYVFHKESDLKKADAVVVPGGFSYGDYLRPGAIAGMSPIVPALREFAASGGPVLGICNGFQILTELGLLPGALTRNRGLRFECRDIHLRVESVGPFTCGLEVGAILRLPIAHADGRYHCDEATLARLEGSGGVAFRYVTAGGKLDDDPEINPNGSIAAIAGVYNEKKNVLGLMPHPERASESMLGSADGFAIFSSLKKHLGATT